jgi:hypothetical protein
MDIEAILQPHTEQCPRILDLDEAQKARLALMVGSVDETVGINHLVDCLGRWNKPRRRWNNSLLRGFRTIWKGAYWMEGAFAPTSQNVGC